MTNQILLVKLQEIKRNLHSKQIFISKIYGITNKKFIRRFNCHVFATINRNIILLQYYKIKREQFKKKVNHCIKKFEQFGKIYIIVILSNSRSYN